MSRGGPEVRSLDGLAALWRAIEYLFVHGIVIVAVTIAAVILARSAAEKSGKPGKLDLGAYCGAFATFGVATAYFLSLGLSAASAAGNSMLQGFVGPFISLLTAAVVFAASRKREEIAKNDLVLGVTCFLLACILSYETFRGQILYGMGTSPGAIETDAPSGPPDNGLQAPTERGLPGSSAVNGQSGSTAGTVRPPPTERGLPAPGTTNDQAGNTAGTAQEPAPTRPGTDQPPPG
jgi:hypothetical protein